MVRDTPFCPAVKAMSASWLLSSGLAHALGAAAAPGAAAVATLALLVAGLPELLSALMEASVPALRGLTRTSILPSGVWTFFTLKMLMSS